jgi:hypothetical protein
MVSMADKTTNAIVREKYCTMADKQLKRTGRRSTPAALSRILLRTAPTKLNNK